MHYGLLAVLLIDAGGLALGLMLLFIAAFILRHERHLRAKIVLGIVAAMLLVGLTMVLVPELNRMAWPHTTQLEMLSLAGCDTSLVDHFDDLSDT